MLVQMPEIICVSNFISNSLFEQKFFTLRPIGYKSKQIFKRNPLGLKHTIILF